MNMMTLLLRPCLFMLYLSRNNANKLIMVTSTCLIRPQKPYIFVSRMGSDLPILIYLTINLSITTHIRSIRPPFSQDHTVHHTEPVYYEHYKPFEWNQSVWITHLLRPRRPSSRIPAITIPPIQQKRPLVSNLLITTTTDPRNQTTGLTCPLRPFVDAFRYLWLLCARFPEWTRIRRPDPVPA